MARFQELLTCGVVPGCYVRNESGHVSQHSLAAVVEVNEGETSVLLPCLYSGFIPEDFAVMWTRNDLHPKSVHLQREGGDDVTGQNQRYSRRTWMRPDALHTLDFSLTLRKPTKTDSGSYICSMSVGREELKLRDIQLQVTDQQEEVEEGSESVILPCKTTADLPQDTSDPELMEVHVYPNKSNLLDDQGSFYRDRTKMNEDLLRTGDLSLTLKYPTERDSGGYICTIYRDKDILRQKVELQVKEPFPSSATALLVLLVLLVVSGGLLFYFRHYFISLFLCQVEVEEGAESVQLPFNTTQNLPEDEQLLWCREEPKPLLLVHVYKNGSDQPEKQHKDYKDRTKMNEDLLRTGDLSLTLKQPRERDSGEYSCGVGLRKGNTFNVTKYKTVLLKVKGRVQVQDQTGDIRNRSSSIDPTPLMADQSV
ncbi:uncharacterized protein LOC113017929 [Astatotilapia calliptera]|uniref:uncharacterized protein LOC113017929 n=1 Tax=Astatotilapia calliptera TaxID=8154 RepID=UPI000E4182E7|nr:uncharacterized protein LOC113017929 [Astatotilapia calliptera]